MAWTAPRTWTDGELVTAAIMNPHIRDNLLSLGPIQRLRKTADQSVTSSTALVDDTHLQFTIAANEVWSGQLTLYTTGATAGDVKYAFNAPVGATGVWGSISPSQSIASATDSTRWEAFTAFGDATLAAPGTLTTPTVGVLYFYVENAGTAGTFKLRWAQLTSSGTATTLLKGSNLMAWRY